MAETKFPVEFVEAAAALVRLPIPECNAEGVRLNLDRIAQVAAPLLAVTIPDEVESAQMFEPAGSGS